MTKNEVIAQLKKENPTLSYGINDQVFEMTPEEYEATIESWADARIAKQKAEEEKAQLDAQRDALLDRLGLTQAEAKLLLS